MSNNKRIPINSVGIKIKDARLKLGLTEEELSWKINDKNITKKQIKKWEKGLEFPDLNSMYKLAYFLEVNPNELLKIRNQIQEESQSEPNWFIRHLFDKIMKVGKPGFKFIFEIILGACVIYLAASWKNFENKMGGARDPEQEEFIEQVIQNGIDEYVYHNTVNDETNYNESSNGQVNNYGL